MAKVKIQGNASGTGVITLTAPNTSTDRTVTLPDADVTLGADATKLPLAGGTVTGQIAIDQNNNARALTIDSESTSESGIVIDASVLTTGRAAHFYSNAPDTSTRDLVHVENAHASSTGTTAFKVTQNSTGLAADFLGDKIRAADGILFGTDTAAANALDDYEEGTWTPALTGDSTAGNTSYNSAATQGIYTKVGRLVTASFTMKLTAKGTINGNITINLPFTPTGFVSGQMHGQSGFCSQVKNMSVTTQGITWRVRHDAASAYMQPIKSGTSPADSYGTHSDLSDTTTLVGTLTYASN